MSPILIIDDESNIRTMMRLSLQAKGYRVETAPDGAEGLAKFGDGIDWDLVLLDHRMPGLTGLEVLREMRTIHPEAKVIMITAFGTIDLAADAMRAGATDFLRKPFTMEVLRGAVEAALHSAPPQAHPPSRTPSFSFGSTSINGFRLSPGPAAPARDSTTGDTIQHCFTITDPQGNQHACTVTLPAYIVELVKAHSDRDAIPRTDNFWLWLCEEALANYLWQIAEIPLDGYLQVTELTTGLRRWVDAVLAP